MKGWKQWAGGIAAAVLLAGAQAAPPPAEAFYKGADIVEAVLSPSGRQLAVTSARGTVREKLIVIDLESGKARHLAQFADADVGRIAWVNDKRLLFSSVDKTKGTGERRDGPGLFAINADGTEQLQLVHRDFRWSDTKERVIEGEARILPPNHLLLSIPTSGPAAATDEVLMARVDWNGHETPLWMNTRTGISRELKGDLPLDVVSWLADAQGELRIAVKSRGRRLVAVWRAPGSDEWQTLYDREIKEGVLFNFNAIDNAGRLFVTHTPGKAGERVLSRFDFEQRTPTAKPLVVTPGFDFSGKLIVDQEGAALGVRVTTDGQTTSWFHPVMKALQEEADARLPNRVNRISCSRCGQPDMTALVLSFSDRDPGRLWIYQAQPAEGVPRWRSVGRVREDINPADMATMSFERIKARDGRDLPVWVTKKADAKGPLPAVVLVHGGPWVRGGVWGWDQDAQFLASRGYVVIEPEFRGSAGYGISHYRAGFRQWGQAMQDDVTDALKWAQATGLASDKACIAGASYGGYSTLIGLAKDPDLYRCGVAWLAVADLEMLVKGSWSVADDTGIFTREKRLPLTIGDGEKDAEMLAANSPVKQAARIKAPVLLAYGEADKRVPLAHGERMRDALSKAGNEPVWVTYAGEGHGWGMVKNRIDFAQRMEAFLAKYLLP